ncbi:alpha-crystallin domain-containing protein 22.3 isoform X2 [Tripterygium wilfordii]|uniref:alpha-crystallin domain-containing protein 22.3 isoform X2 n=1 Tax=Tripterygium wilfordii TaxID=458696 RepID=UPI0018F81363|nr:alpha-crystallin domain-containing protein 22.3 isoform X2 [Tripterygium wilfordii]
MMARSSATFGKASESNGAIPINSQQRVLSVAPLRSIPYVGPSVPSSPLRNPEAKPVEEFGPAIIFMPSHSREDNILASAKTGFSVTGSAALGKAGLTMGLVDIAESSDSYLFRVSLPGVAMDDKDFSCDIRPDGKITIKGVTNTGEKTVRKNSQVFKMLTQNLSPPGHFSIVFHLPVPVDPQQCQGAGANGILQCIVKKK